MLDRTRIFDLILRARARVGVPVLSVLCYHSVGAPGGQYAFDPDVIDATPEQFREQLEVLDRYFTVISMEQLCKGMDSGAFPPNPALITFDDGYRSCVDTALPILQEFGFPATFFIATSYVDERRLYWWDQIHYLVNKSTKQQLHIQYPYEIHMDTSRRKEVVGRLLRLVKDERNLDLDEFLASLATAAAVDWNRDIETHMAEQLVMSWDHVRELHGAGMDIESHTRSHRVLQTLAVDQLAGELAGSRRDIEREVGASVRAIAYPVGHGIRHDPMIVSAARRAGYRVGFTNATGINHPWHLANRFDIRRVATARGQPLSMFRGILAVPLLAYTHARP